MLFLHRIYAHERTFGFVETNLPRLRSQLFLDGRTCFWDGDEKLVRIDLAQGLSTGPQRTIFHMAFCGSTLLARLLDEASDASVLKEPQCLIDLADWQRAIDLGVTSRKGFDVASQRACNALWLSPDGLPIVVKPSNWANNLMPSLARLPQNMPAVLVTIRIEDFLRAVLRGGRERLAFAARAAAHLASAFSNGDQLVAAAIASGTDGLTRTLNLAALLHHLQTKLFAGYSDLAGPDAGTIDFRTITSEPEEALRRAASALGLTLDRGRMAAILSKNRHRHSKDSSKQYDQAVRLEEDRVVVSLYGSAMESATDFVARLDVRLRGKCDVLGTQGA